MPRATWGSAAAGNRPGTPGGLIKWPVKWMTIFGASWSMIARSTIRKLKRIPGADFAWTYWKYEFPALLKDRGYAAQALNPPRNKLERLISTREIDTLLRHPHALDLAGIDVRRDVVQRDDVPVVLGDVVGFQ